MARHHAIKMVMIDQLPKEFEVTSVDMKYEHAHLLKDSQINLPNVVAAGAKK
jgi:hypothetical protein